MVCNSPWVAMGGVRLLHLRLPAMSCVLSHCCAPPHTHTPTLVRTGTRGTRRAGAVANDTSVAVAKANSLAIMAAFAAADAGGASGGDNVVEVPHGQTFYVFNSTMRNLTDVRMVLDGTLVMSNNQSAWVGTGKHEPKVGALTFFFCDGLTITGAGKVDGQGYEWWWTVLLTHVGECQRV